MKPRDPVPHSGKLLEILRVLCGDSRETDRKSRTLGRCP